MGSALGDYVRLTGGFWKGETRRQAWFLTVSCVILIGLTIAVQFGITQWNRYFFDALDQKNSQDVAWAVGLFAALLVASSVVAMAGVAARMRLQVSWRQWLAIRLTGQW